jgi:peptidoglycan-associated lipoprotein
MTAGGRISLIRANRTFKGGVQMSREIYLLTATLVLAPVLMGATCPPRSSPDLDLSKPLPADLESIRDCAPEYYQAARLLVDQAQALNEKNRPEQTEIAALAARRIVEKAKWECEEKRRIAAATALEAMSTNKESLEPASSDVIFEEDISSPAGLLTVYFGFDQFILSDEARQTLLANAEYLRLHKNLKIQVEGHCDERGSTEYNLALGDRRAKAVRKYLMRLGIRPDRLETISYGKERPVDFEQGESAWSKNRRSEFKGLSD